ncbi:MAG: chemotaxis protein methyltransferase CheR [Xanthomonadaceae bacterium]|nr:chemotaxis protein methyltransferase CheR [Xanthomonadaceae bacterium]
MGGYFQSRWFAYFVAASTSLIALLVRLQTPWLFEGATFMPFFMAILVSAWLGGLGPGLLATALCGLAGDWYLLDPVGAFGMSGRGQGLQLLLFAVLGVAMSVACQWLHNARDRASRMRADINELQRMEDNLRQLAADLSEAGRRKDRFLATLSHELRNPLAPIRNALELIKRANSNPDTIELARAAMERQLLQMVRLVDDLLDVSRITRDKLELRREIVTLQSVLDNAMEAAQPCIAEHGHRLSVSLPPQTVWLSADPARMAQVFSNLLNNAAKYTNHGGTLELIARLEADDEVIVSVIDNGIGVPRQEVAKVLEMFGQVDDSLERAEGGLGIGLSLAKRLVEMHNGRIDLRAAPGGSGTEVEVRLTTAMPPLRPHPALPAPAAAADYQRRRVLVVDDNVDSAQTLAMVLDVMGHETRLANDGMQAVQIAQQFQPEVVLLDIGMPKLNGYEACRLIRAQPWATEVKMVAVTGWGQDEDRRRSKDAGFDLHLVKPLDPVEVERLLRKLEPGRRPDSMFIA